MFRFLLLLVVALGATACVTTGHNKLPVPTSNKASNPSNLVSLNGKPFPLLSQVKKHKATVLAWWATQCPCVKRYQQRIEQLKAQYSTQKVQVLAIASNADDSPLVLWKNAVERRFQVPILLDKNGQLARYLGVSSTPTVVILDAEGKVRFFGWIDNERKPGESGRVAYAEDALKSLLQDQPIGLSRAPFYGCTITRGFSTQTKYQFVPDRLLADPNSMKLPQSKKVAKEKKRPAKPCACKKK